MNKNLFNIKQYLIEDSDVGIQNRYGRSHLAMDCNYGLEKDVLQSS